MTWESEQLKSKELWRQPDCWVIEQICLYKYCFSLPIGGPRRPFGLGDESGHRHWIWPLCPGSLWELLNMVITTNIHCRDKRWFQNKHEPMRYLHCEHWNNMNLFHFRVIRTILNCYCNHRFVGLVVTIAFSLCLPGICRGFGEHQETSGKTSGPKYTRGGRDTRQPCSMPVRDNVTGGLWSPVSRWK